jgi:hypothetical protein
MFVFVMRGKALKLSDPKQACAVSFTLSWVSFSWRKDHQQAHMHASTTLGFWYNKLVHARARKHNVTHTQTHLATRLGHGQGRMRIILLLI